MSISSILFVEDCAADLQQFKRFLKQEHFKMQYTFVGRLSEAYEALKRHAFDLIITDIRLPDGCGLQLAEHVSIISPHIPVVCISGVTDLDVITRAAKCGVTHFLTKPYSYENLRQVIAEIGHFELAIANKDLHHVRGAS